MTYSQYLQSTHWQETRKYKLTSHPQCQVCDSLEKLNIHHKRYKHNGKSVLNNEKQSTLITLCSSCHRLFHKYIGIEYPKVNKRILQIRRLISLGVKKKFAFICTENIDLFIATKNKAIDFSSSCGVTDHDKGLVSNDKQS